MLIQFTFDRVQISTAGQRSVRIITHYGRLEISDIILSNYLPYYTYQEEATVCSKKIYCEPFLYLILSYLTKSVL